MELISAARHLGTDEIKRMLADRGPKPSLPTSIRRMAEPPKAGAPMAFPAPAPTPPAQVVAPPTPIVPPCPKARTEPLGAERYRVQFTADRETHAQLEELRALMRHQVPDGDVGKILAKAISVLLERVRKQKFAETSTPRPGRAATSRNEPPSRHIPAAIRRAVWQRDGGRCTYVSVAGRRCDAKEFIEFDHTKTWVWARSHSIDGITLRCRAHNQQRARQDFGDEHMARFRGTGSKSSSSPNYVDLPDRAARAPESETTASRARLS
jgi:hypothetical protein